MSFGSKKSDTPAPVPTATPTTNPDTSQITRTTSTSPEARDRVATNASPSLLAPAPETDEEKKAKLMSGGTVY